MIKKRAIQIGGGLLILCLLSLASCRYSSIYFRSPEISGTVVDSKTGQPLAGVKVTVRWAVMRSTENMHNPDSMNLNSYIATTDSNGRFTVPAWGPEKLDWGWFYFATDPQASFSLSGHDLGEIYNKNHAGFEEIQPWPFQTVTYELPSWNGQKIPR